VDAVVCHSGAPNCVLPGGALRALAGSISGGNVDRADGVSYDTSTSPSLGRLTTKPNLANSRAVNQSCCRFRETEKYSGVLQGAAILHPETLTKRASVRETGPYGQIFKQPYHRS